MRSNRQDDHRGGLEPAISPGGSLPPYGWFELPEEGWTYPEDKTAPPRAMAIPRFAQASGALTEGSSSAAQLVLNPGATRDSLGEYIEEPAPTDGVMVFALRTGRWGHYTVVSGSAGNNLFRFRAMGTVDYTEDIPTIEAQRTKIEEGEYVDDEDYDPETLFFPGAHKVDGEFIELPIGGEDLVLFARQILVDEGEGEEPEMVQHFEVVSANWETKWLADLAEELEPEATGTATIERNEVEVDVTEAGFNSDGEPIPAGRITVFWDGEKLVVDGGGCMEPEEEEEPEPEPE